MAATTFGYQFFVLHLHQGTKRSTEDFATATLGAGGPTLLESLRLVRGTVVNSTRTGDLFYRERTETDTEPVTAGTTRPAIRVTHLSAVSEHRVDFQFRYGRVGSHDIAIATDAGEDAVLANKASTNEFRAVLYLPTSGHSGLLVVENRSNLCPAEYLLKHLSFALKEQDEDRPEAERIGWWRLMPKPATDSNRLDEVLRQGTGAALQLQRHVVKNGKRREDTITVRQDGLPASKFGQVRALAYDWLGRTDPEADPDDQSNRVPSGTAVEQIAALIDIDVSPDQFDDGALVYDDGDGHSKTIRPHDIRDVFVYPLGRGHRPELHEIRAAAEARIPALAQLLQIPIDL